MVMDTAIVGADDAVGGIEESQLLMLHEEGAARLGIAADEEALVSARHWDG
jgi:hypothetical protein